MKNKGKLYLALFVCLTIIIIIFNSSNIYKFYIKVTRKSEMIENRNDKGELDGGLTSYVNGNVYIKVNFKNGLKNGWAMKYFENGQVKNKAFYKNGRLEGVETEYYNNSKPHYESNYRDGKYYGSGWNWSKSGKLFVYNTSDISGQLFYYSEYDTLETATKAIGDVFSTRIFSVNTKDSSIVVLKDKKPCESINDLFITVSTPPHLTPQVRVDINNSHFEFLKIHDNTITVKDVFKNVGVFKINIHGYLLDDKRHIDKSDTLFMIINKNL